VGRIEFGNDRALKQGDRQNQAVLALCGYEYPLEHAQRTRFNANSLADLKERVRTSQYAGVYDRRQGFNLVEIDWVWLGAETHDRFDSRGTKNGKAVVRIEPAK
jgi:hypothetical protein